MPTMYKPRKTIIWESFFYTKNGWLRADLPDVIKQGRTVPEDSICTDYLKQFHLGKDFHINVHNLNLAEKW